MAKKKRKTRKRADDLPEAVAGAPPPDVQGQIARDLATQDRIAEAREQDMSHVLAQDLLDGFQEKGRAEKRKRELMEQQNRIYYYECRRCHLPAIWFTEDPGTKLITPDMWWANYRRVSDPWFQPFILCQACLANKRTTHLVMQVDVRGNGFRCYGTYRRHIKYMRIEPTPAEKRGHAKPTVKLPAEPAPEPAEQKEEEPLTTASE